MGAAKPGINITLYGETSRMPRLIIKEGQVLGIKFGVRTAREYNGKVYTDYYTVLQWGEGAEELNNRLNMGQNVKVEANRIKGTPYIDKNGTQRADLEVTAVRVLFLEEGDMTPMPERRPTAPTYENKTKTAAELLGFDPDGPDEEIPF